MCHKIGAESGLNMLLVLFYLLLGAVANAFRGGMFLEGIVGSQVRRITYCAVFGFAAWHIGAEAWQAWAAALWLFAMHLTGWGRAVGAVGGCEDKPLKEFYPFDRVADFFFPYGGKVAWGFAWLTLWGFVAGLGLACILNAWWVVPAFATMGCVYYICLRIGAYFEKNGWALSELVYGAICLGSLIM